MPFQSVKLTHSAISTGMARNRMSSTTAGETNSHPAVRSGPRMPDPRRRRRTGPAVGTRPTVEVVAIDALPGGVVALREAGRRLPAGWPDQLLGRFFCSELRIFFGSSVASL